jgi:hypothetical protein
MQAPALSFPGTFPAPAGGPASSPISALKDAADEADPAAPPASAPPLPALPPSWTSHLLAEGTSFSLRREATRFGVGLGLAALYGLALGARAGGRSFLAHAAGVPAALAAAIGLGVPALYIVLALFDAPIEAPRVASAASRACAAAGLVLAGLAPAAALFVVSSERPGAAAFAAAAGLATGGAIGLARLVRELHDALGRARIDIRSIASLAFAGFGVFAVALSFRVWWALLPVLGGVR